MEVENWLEDVRTLETEAETIKEMYPEHRFECRLCFGFDRVSDADRATHCVYHVVDAESSSFWNVQGGRVLTGEQLLDRVRQTNARFREGLPMSARVYVCERCFTHHAVIQSRNAPHETPDGRLVCAGCVLKK